MRLKVFTLIFSYLAGTALGHGYLAEPPGRASAWRYGFDTPVDYNDNQCYCGGFNFQYNSMGGKCGLCGDPWNQDPREHEVGGTYATGTIVRDYVQGQVIQAIANITTNHLGYIEYKICANNDVTVEATQDCLDLTPLYAVGRDDWHLNIDDAKGAVKFDLQLPADLTCTQCVLQWRYVTGNTWGTCENGTEALGCGPQEEFRSCADVSISAPKSDVTQENSAEKVIQQDQPLGHFLPEETPESVKGNLIEIKSELRKDSDATNEKVSDNSFFDDAANANYDSQSGAQMVGSEQSTGEFFQSEQGPQFEAKSQSETKSEAIANHEKITVEDSSFYSKSGRQQQKALKLIEEMAVAVKSKTEMRLDSQQGIGEALTSETRGNDEENDIEEEEEESDSGSDSEIEEDDD